MSMRILVIDDELARLAHKREEFLCKWALFPEAQFRQAVEFTFISSQRKSSDRIDNDASLAVEHVALNPAGWALVLLDMQFDHGALQHGEPISADPQFGLEIQRALEAQFPNLPIVQFTAQDQSALHRHDGVYLSKMDGSLDDLRLLLVTHGRVSMADKRLLLQIPDDTIVASDSTVASYLEVYRSARGNAPLLIRGEMGTGKEHLARYFHRVSARKDGPYVALQVSALPSTLYEAELFGHEKGAFTGADKSAPGAFGRAEDGTIFLDEVGALPAELQAKLLRVIGERMFRKVGGQVDQAARCGIVAATQDDLRSLGFRRDLQARFNEVTLAPLRQRREELAALALYLLERAQGALDKRGMVFSQQALEAIHGAALPENVRSLDKAIQRAVRQLSSNSVVGTLHLRLDSEEAEQRDKRSAQAISHAVETSGQSPPVVAPAPPSAANLRSVLTSLDKAALPRNVDQLRGLLEELQAAVAIVHKEIALAALQTCRHPVSGKLKIQPAMQLILNDPAVSAMKAKRKLNELLGCNQDLPIDLTALEAMLAGRET